MATSNWQQKRPGQDDSGSAGDAILNRDDRSAGAGAVLRQAREEMGWNIQQVGQSLKIRPEYLDAFERNSLEGLPGPAYAMGFLKTYADFLHLDTNEIVRRFKAEKSGLGRRPELAFPVPLTDRGIPGGGLFLTALILIALGYGTWYYMSSGRHSTPPAVEPVPAQLLNPPVNPAPPATSSPQNVVSSAPSSQTSETPPAAAPVSPSSPDTSAPPAATQTPAAVPPVSPSPEQIAPVQPSPPGSSTSGPAAAPAAASNLHSYGLPTAGHIVLHANASAWVQVKENGLPIFTRVLQSGDSYNVPDRPGMVMRTGNAGGVEVMLDGKTLPPLGAQGQVKGNIQLDPAKLASARSN